VGAEKQLAVQVTDATGKIVYNQNFQQVQGEKGVELSLNHLTPGLYHVVIKSSKGETRSNLQIIR